MPSTSADLAMLEPFDVVQHERGPASFGQPGQRALEIHLRHAPIRKARLPASYQPGSSSSVSVTCLVRTARLLRYPGIGSWPADTARCRARTRRGSSPASGAPKRKISCSRSSASAGLPTIRAARLYNFPACALYSSSNAPEISCPDALHQRHFLRPGDRSWTDRWRGMNCYFRRRHAAPALPRAGVKDSPPRDITDKTGVMFLMFAEGVRPERGSDPVFRRSTRPFRLLRIPRIESGAPSTYGKIPDSGTGDGQAFGAQERTFHRLVSAISAQAPGGCDHAVAGNALRGTSAHDVADRTARPRDARKLGDVAVRGHASRRDAAHDGQYPPSEAAAVHAGSLPPGWGGSARCPARPGERESQSRTGL